MTVPYFSDTKQVSFFRTKQNIQQWEPCLSGERESRVGARTGEDIGFDSRELQSQISGISVGFSKHTSLCYISDFTIYRDKLH